MIRKKRNIIIFIICGLILIPASFLGYIYYKITLDAAARIERGAIDRIIASESPVFYDDGVTPIGVFFEKTHRKYIQYEDIPKVFIKALIAAEDKNFLAHWGFDLKATLRAFIANIKTGKVVQGGSTITQQTAKNIFRREKKSYKAKLKELIQAFLLERKYTKEEIIEMYANQFFVNGYGKGLSIASQYFFDKETKDLDLVESAFIAGSVKGPNRYNPFIKKTEKEKDKAIQLARLRKDYVLSKMLKMNFITENQYLEAKEKDIPFKEGKITYRLNVVLDYIREQLESGYFSTILQEQGVDNIATSGIIIHTSINKDIQEAALRNLRTHLPVMDVKLNGYNVKQIVDTHQELLKKGPMKPKDALPFLSQITHIEADGKNGYLTLTWDNGSGIINYEGLKTMGEAWFKWKMGDWADFDKKHVRMFLKNFHVGDLIPVKLLSCPKNNCETKLMLSEIPELNGGVVVLQKGMVRAMVGGFFNRFFNRSVDAKRQLGSIFKPIVYLAALQLKWNSLDPLQNIRNMFQFENTFYQPRPDHTPQSQKVSMAWAGIKSENLATVWLLYHLTDHLNMSEFRQVTSLVGLDKKEGEPYQAYKNRIRDQFGVVVNKEALMETAFEESKKLIESDIIFGGYERILNNLHRMYFDIDVNKFNFETPEEQQILRFSHKRLRELNLKMKEQLHNINQLLEQYKQNKTPNTIERLSHFLFNFYLSEVNGKRKEIIYVEQAGSPSSTILIPITTELLVKRTTPLTSGEIWIDGLITSGIMDLLQENMKKIYRQLVIYNRYDYEVLSRVRDFRTLVNLSYVAYLSKKIGISTKLDPVLSFPLGPNAISILEAALAYQTIMTGQIYPLNPEGDLKDVPIITKIVDREGEILWEYKPEPKKVLSSRVSGLVTDILRNVMELGTGRKAKDAIRVFDIPIPTFGKTGTANHFTNSSFVGFIPGCNKETGQLDINEGYVIASYVGYDDNRPMKSKHSAIYGASGALPIWIDTSNAIVKTHEYKENLQLADLAFNPLLGLLSKDRDLRTVPVSPLTGLPEKLSNRAIDSPAQPRILADVEERGDSWVYKRHFDPALPFIP
jgi:membrane peptidoglycan carboxypeptidase